jgi:biotin carboxylase
MTHTDQVQQDDGYLIVVSSLGQSSREPFFQTVSTRFRIWLFIGGAGRAAEPSWELPYIAGHTAVDTLDADAMLAAAQDLAKSTPILGILSYDEARIEATAKVATALCLPTSPAASILRCRDKHMTRQALDAAGVPQARSVAVRSLDEAVQVANEIGYPVVLKPRNLAASFGVTRADSDADVAAAYSAARTITLPEAPEVYEDGVLVEEYLDGPELSIDSACFDGRVEPMAVAHKRTGFPPNFEEMGHLVDGADPLLDDAEIRAVTVAAHQAVGFHTGVTHLELKLTSTGPKVIELNARLGGDLIPHLGHLAGGPDLELAAAVIATGAAPDLTRGSARVAGVRFYYPEADLTVGAISIDRSVLPGGVERAMPLADVGQEVLLPPRGSAWVSRLAQIVVVADSEAACNAALDAAAAAVVVEPADVHA